MQNERDNKSDAPFDPDWEDFFALLQKFGPDFTIDRNQPIEQQVRDELSSGLLNDN